MPQSKPKQPPQPKPARGRPRLTPEALETRIHAYCKRYGVASEDRGGLPPFPAGKRETAQHRQWIALYNAHKRLARRETLGGVSAEDLAGLLEAQGGRCPVCDQSVSAADGACDIVEARARGVLHPKCRELVADLRALRDPGVLERLRRYLGEG